MGKKGRINCVCVMCIKSLTLSITSNTVEAAPKAVANVCNSGSAFPRERLPINIAMKTYI